MAFEEPTIAIMEETPIAQLPHHGKSKAFKHKSNASGKGMLSSLALKFFAKKYKFDPYFIGLYNPMDLSYPRSRKFQNASEFP